VSIIALAAGVRRTRGQTRGRRVRHSAAWPRPKASLPGRKSMWSVVPGVGPKPVSPKPVRNRIHLAARKRSFWNRLRYRRGSETINPEPAPLPSRLGNAVLWGRDPAKYGRRPVESARSGIFYFARIPAPRQLRGNSAAKPGFAGRMIT
jgi:hypothetical protein